MAHTKFPVEILSPEGQVFEGEVEMLSTRTTTGSIGILANHTPLLATLDPTELRLYESENEVSRFAQGEGYVQVCDNRALMLVEEAHRPEDLDRGGLRQGLARVPGRGRQGPRPRGSAGDPGRRRRPRGLRRPDRGPARAPRRGSRSP